MGGGRGVEKGGGIGQTRLSRSRPRPQPGFRFHLRLAEPEGAGRPPRGRGPGPAPAPASDLPRPAGEEPKKPPGLLEEAGAANGEGLVPSTCSEPIPLWVAVGPHIL